MVANMKKGETIEDNGVKISRKISAKEFVHLLGKEPSRIEIPKSVLDQLKTVSLMLKVMEKTREFAPDIVITKQGKPFRSIKFKPADPINPTIRSQVGYRPTPPQRLLVHLLDAKKSSVPMSELTPNEIKMLPKLQKIKRVTVTNDLKVKLTKLGVSIAEGAKKLYPEYWR